MTLSVCEAEALSRSPLVIEKLESSYLRRPQCWRDVTEDEWASYDWQWQNRLMTADDIGRVTALSPDEIQAISMSAGGFSACISPHYASLIRSEEGSSCPIRRQCVPSMREFETHDDLMTDPLGEYRHAVTSCSTRRYPDRVLIYSTHACAMRCRHCTRRGRVGMNETITRKSLEDAVECVLRDDRVRDVLISGGDPLSLANDDLRWLIETLKTCPHIDVVRVCTRMPCTLPQRMNDPELLSIFREFAPIYLNTQFNHPYEATVESARALKTLREAGCILGNQSVLLRDVNDRGEIFEPLYRWLLREGCRPYYLFLCDVAQGTEHFRTPISSGLDIMRHLRGRLSGLGIPHFVVDLPDGYGKVDLCPANPTGDGERLVFRNWFGAEVEYRDAAAYEIAARGPSPPAKQLKTQ